MRFSTPAILVAATALLGFAAADDHGRKSAADYYVRNLPGLPKDGQVIKMHAGHIEVDPDHNGNLFFWHFQNKHIDKRQRTVIWLNGGPGCSSMDGAWMEVGPYRVHEDGKKLLHNEGSWNEFANLLFVDQPVGTGFSYVNSDSYLHELDEMARQFIIFMEKFFEIFPQYEKDDIYFAGESYAGQHIPYIADAILKRNEQNAFNGGWNLKGLLIGNGWMDPEPQYMSYLPFAEQHGLIKDPKVQKQLEKQQSICQKTLEAGGKDHVDTTDCEVILQEILRLTGFEEKGRDMCTNMYDVRLVDTYPSCGMNWPSDLPQLTSYLQRKDVVEAIHINPDKKTGWTECAGAVSQNFRARNSKPAMTLLPDILQTVPVLLFSGDQDLICNHIGTEDSIHALEWNGGKGFELSPGNWAPREDWVFEGQPAGIYQSARNLTYVMFYNASHMVPYDEPRRSRDMLDRFMGVDIATIGGDPADSLIAGEKGPLVAVGNHPNSTVAKAAEEEKLKNERWNAYYKSGEIALILVASAAFVWAIWIYRSRRQARSKRMQGYKGVSGDEVNWDEEEGRLNDLAPVSPGDARRYSLGGSEDSGTEDESEKKKESGKD